MTLLLILIISLPSIIHSYNLDDKYPLIYTDPIKSNVNSNSEEQGSYFGYSVMLIPEYDKFDSQLVVGAPKGNYSELGKSVKEPGIAYQCNLSRKCQPISPTSDSPPDIAVKQIGMYAKVIQDNGWFGMSIAAIHPTLLKICAPRTKINLFKPFTNAYTETMQGICYFYSKSTENTFLQIETESLTTYNFSSFHWYNPQHGFSQNVAVGISPRTKLNIQEKSESIIKMLLKNTSMIIGNPTNQASGSINIAQLSKRKTLEISNNGHEQAEFGYSVTSGYYFGKNKTFFASGAPVWNFVGKVGVINNSAMDPVITMFLHGHTLGEYFGASLTTGDLNYDGFDDLIVGAPHYGDNIGKIYIYLGSRDGFLDYNPVIEGSIIGGQFGYSLSCGDLDRDGFSVGAPWEESGVIYIYNGYSTLDEENTLQMSQKISATKISAKLRGFGFSISNLADLDNNGFVDVAVGAYKSGHAVILRAKPVEKTQIDFKVQPTALKKNTQRVSPEFCLKNYKSLNSQIIKNYTLMVVIDSKLKRFTYDNIIWDVPVRDKTYQEFQYRYSSQPKASRLTNPHWNGCTTSHFNTKSDIQNFIDPVDIILTYELNSYQVKSTKNDTNYDDFCKLCPIKYLGRENKPMKLSLPYELGCEKDKICNSDISVTTSVHGVGKNNTWEIGSGDVAIEVKFQNHGEPAYLVVVIFVMPKGIHLRSILSFCQEEISENDLLIISCEVGNPFDKGAQKIIKLDMDMRYFETHNLTSLEQQKLFINMTVKTQTQNQGVKQISIPIILQNNVSSSIIGKTDEDSYYLTTTQQKIANITFQHAYNVFKHGPTPITQGQITIEIPTRIDGGEPFIELKKPQLQVFGLLYDCSSNDIPLQSTSYVQSTKTFNFDKVLNNNRTEIGSPMFKKRKRRDLKSAADELTTTDSTQDIEKNFKNNKIFVDCSNQRIQCGSITCDLIPLKTSQDIGTIVLSLTIQLKLLNEIFITGSVLHFSTKAQVNIVKPLRTSTEVQVLTTLYNMEEIFRPKELNIWIILGSLIVGLIILVIIISILYYIGFFRKKQKLELNYLKVNKNEGEIQHSIEKLNNEEIIENSTAHSESGSLNSG